MKKLIMGLYFLSSIASAERLDDVKVLSVVPKPDSVELKLQAKDGLKDSYFYVEIVKSDADSFQKLVQVLNKTTKKEKYKLGLDIPSFSPSPNGSYYKSEGLIFTGKPK